jgi:hypothetical protein
VYVLAYPGPSIGKQILLFTLEVARFMHGRPGEKHVLYSLLIKLFLLADLYSSNVVSPCRHA